MAKVENTQKPRRCFLISKIDNFMGHENSENEFIKMKYTLVLATTNSKISCSISGAIKERNTSLYKSMETELIWIYYTQQNITAKTQIYIKTYLFVSTMREY